MDEQIRPRVLIVEDEWLIADLLQEMVVELGYEPIGPASSVGEAVELIDRFNPDAALLDVCLAEENSFPIADAMTSRGAPFLFLTGYADGNLPAHYRSNPVICKPISIRDLQAPLARLFLTAPAPPLAK